MQLNAEISIVGNLQTGAGYIVTSADGQVEQYVTASTARTCQCALNAASYLLWQHGIRGQCHVYAPGGRRMATINLSRPGKFFSLSWRPVPTDRLNRAYIGQTVAA